MRDDGDKKQDQENKKQNPGDFGCCEGDKSESQHPRYQRNDQKDQGIIQHGFHLLVPRHCYGMGKLELTVTKLPSTVLVIDHVEYPSEN